MAGGHIDDAGQWRGAVPARDSKARCFDCGTPITSMGAVRPCRGAPIQNGSPHFSVALTTDEVAALREVLADPETYAPLLWLTDDDTETRREYEHPERAGRLAALAAVAAKLAEVAS